MSDDLLREMFVQSQNRGIREDPKQSAEMGVAGSELLIALAHVRTALLKAASDAGLPNPSFIPEDNPSAEIDYLDTPEGQLPYVEFALTSKSDASPLTVTIRGSAVRSVPRMMRAALYLFAPLDLSILSGTGEAKSTRWQPMANGIDGQDDESTVPRVDPHYHVDGTRLRMILEDLNRSAR